MPVKRFDVAIVGGGPGGLAVSQQLAARRISNVVFERGDHAGWMWGQVYDSLRLHTGKHLSSLPHSHARSHPDDGAHYRPSAHTAEGNLYEGTVSDVTPDFRGTLEKKTNEDADDWSDIDAVVAALQDPSDGGLEALAKAVDLDRFLSFWATEVLVGHWDGYSGDHNNYHLYREPDGPFVFIPWGVDDTFHLKDYPNLFDNINNPPPSVLALSAIPNRLYNNADWRLKYVVRL